MEDIGFWVNFVAENSNKLHLHLEEFHDRAFDEWKNQRQKSSHLDLAVLLKEAQIPINIACLVFIVP